LRKIPENVAEQISFKIGVYYTQGDRWFITPGSLLLKHNQSRFLWFWRFIGTVIGNSKQRWNKIS